MSEEAADVPFFDVGYLNPIYRLETQSDQKLEYLAWQIRRVKAFKKYLPIREIPSDEADISTFVDAEERHQEAMLRVIMSTPALTNSVVLLLDWIRSNQPEDRAKLQQLVDALDVYEPSPTRGLSHLTDSQLARLHIILACWTFEGETGDEHWGDVPPNALEIRKRTLALFDETKVLAGLPLASRNITKVRWDRLFLELRIELKFPHGGWDRV